MTDENERRAHAPDAVDPRRRHPDPPRVRDAHAHTHFAALVLTAIDELVGLAAPLAVVASAPNRFNDVAWYDWALVRVADEGVERDAYCVAVSEHQGDLARASDRVRAASRVLERLEHAGWRELFTQSYGLGFGDEFLALVVQDGARWLVYASSNCGGREHVFALGGEEPIAYEAECVTRTDDELIDGRGLVFARWDEPF